MSLPYQSLPKLLCTGIDNFNYINANVRWTKGGVKVGRNRFKPHLDFQVLYEWAQKQCPERSIGDFNALDFALALCSVDVNTSGCPKPLLPWDDRGSFEEALKQELNRYEPGWPDLEPYTLYEVIFRRILVSKTLASLWSGTSPKGKLLTAGDVARGQFQYFVRMLIGSICSDLAYVVDGFPELPAPTLGEFTGEFSKRFVEGAVGSCGCTDLLHVPNRLTGKSQSNSSKKKCADSHHIMKWSKESAKNGKAPTELKNAPTHELQRRRFYPLDKSLFDFASKALIGKAKGSNDFPDERDIDEEKVAELRKAGVKDPRRKNLQLKGFTTSVLCRLLGTIGLRLKETDMVTRECDECKARSRKMSCDWDPENKRKGEFTTIQNPEDWGEPESDDVSDDEDDAPRKGPRRKKSKGASSQCAAAYSNKEKLKIARGRLVLESWMPGPDSSGKETYQVAHFWICPSSEAHAFYADPKQPPFAKCPRCSSRAPAATVWTCDSSLPNWLDDLRTPVAVDAWTPQDGPCATTRRLFWLAEKTKDGSRCPSCGNKAHQVRAWCCERDREHMFITRESVKRAKCPVCEGEGRRLVKEAKVKEEGKAKETRKRTNIGPVQAVYRGDPPEKLFKKGPAGRQDEGNGLPAPTPAGDGGGLASTCSHRPKRERL